MNIKFSNLKFNNLVYKNNPKKIIIHNADSYSCSVYDIDRWHKENGWSGIGYHYFIRKDGTIYIGRPENAIGAHTKNHNSTSIGICLEGKFMVEKPTNIQINSLYELISDIIQRRNYMPIYGHKDLNNTNCPGEKFPLEILKNNFKVDSSLNGFFETFEIRKNATIVGKGNIQVMDNKGMFIPGRYIESLDRVFVLGIYPSYKHIEVIYPAKEKNYHAYISIDMYSRLKFDYHMEYKNDSGITYVWWNSKNVNNGIHDEELESYQKASPMYRENNWLRITFYRKNGVPSDGFVRYEGNQEKNFYN
ncbi:MULTISPECIES: N-acetylmuramoyl-L-alanine amidase [Bacillota]|uniref:N-acetylmuramoyl-L-alanine amidase n=2 Tax=Bacillota TaxID=1239 RepID=A0A9X3XWZ7_ENTFC|nr:MULTISPECIES: N-acetylmuramoyl-L-alanine amidase [Bacillota]MDC4242499.1 N-acetylmuramoyl-L-alanine amidase [Clostridium tertium]MDC4246159.1 N-acetylmuramoyl-L-alanine amidase [Clostridium perfringens]MDC4249070.1 N-acetylmuramoyl-L-alanine amidase [Enterococcus faecium]